MTTINIDELVAKYVALRDGIEALEAEAKKQKAPLEIAMATISSVLMKLCNDQGVKQFKTTAGTAFIATKTQCGVENWDAALAEILSTGNHQLLNKAVNKTAVQEYIQKHERPPPGVKWTVMNEIQVRRA